MPSRLEEIERALAMAAYLVERHGPEFLPIFERCERELEAALNGPQARARRVLAEYAAGRMRGKSVRPSRGLLADFHRGGLAMKVQWRRAAFRVLTRDGDLRKVVGPTWGRFGIWDVTCPVTSNGRNVTWYLVDRATGANLLAFARQRDAKLAAEIIADMDLDGTDGDEAADRLMRAGFYITGTRDLVGNAVWRLLFDNPKPRHEWAPDAPEGTTQWLH